MKSLAKTTNRLENLKIVWGGIRLRFNATIDGYLNSRHSSLCVRSGQKSKVKIVSAYIVAGKHFGDIFKRAKSLAQKWIFEVSTPKI